MPKSMTQELIVKERKVPELWGYPLSIIFILGNEFCERFSFYGMKTILIFFLTDKLRLDNDSATSIVHAFVMVAYFMPLLGSIIADVWLGKFHTIWSLSIIYAVGNVVIALSALPSLLKVWVAALGLILIGLGTGGIKPCVSAFGGDQFDKGKETQREKFFSIFYFAINAGSVLSTFLTPILRGKVHCFGDQLECFPLAFAVPGLLMFLAILLFVFGSPWYTKLKPTGNVVLDTAKVILSAIKNRFKSNRPKRSHWVEYADESKFGWKFIQDVRGVMGVLFMFIPLPFFWALFDQQSSRWTLQASLMNGQITSSFRLEPDQVQVLNPLLILVLIPIFTSVIFPILDKFHIPNRHLQRMVAGMLLAAVSFVIAGVLQIQIEANIRKKPLDGQSTAIFFNSLPCDLSLDHASTDQKAWNLHVPAFTDSGFLPYDSTKNMTYNFTIGFNDCTNYTTASQYSVTLNSRQGDIVLIWSHPLPSKAASHVIVTDSSPTTLDKPTKGLANVRLLLGVPNLVSPVVYLRAKAGDDIVDKIIGNVSTDLAHRALTSNTTSAISEYAVVMPEDDYEVYLYLNYTNMTTKAQMVKHGFQLSAKSAFMTGGRYLLHVYPDYQNKYAMKVFEEQKSNSIHMLWQAPQYFVMTAGEVIFSPTGLAFAYSQSPVSMRSVLQAAWLLTVSFGNLIVVIMAEIQKVLKMEQSVEFFIFAGLMLLFTVIFGIMAVFYKYKTPEEVDTDSVGESDEVRTAPNGVPWNDRDANSNEPVMANGIVGPYSELRRRLDEDDDQTHL